MSRCRWVWFLLRLPSVACRRPSLRYVLTRPSLSRHTLTYCISLCVQIPSPYKAYLVTYLFLETFSPNMVIFWCTGVRTSTNGFGGQTICPLTYSLSEDSRLSRILCMHLMYPFFFFEEFIGLFFSIVNRFPCVHGFKTTNKNIISPLKWLLSPVNFILYVEQSICLINTKHKAGNMVYKMKKEVCP